MRVVVLLVLALAVGAPATHAFARGIDGSWKLTTACPDGTHYKGTMRLAGKGTSGTINMGKFSGTILDGGLYVDGLYRLIVQPPGRPYIDSWAASYSEKSNMFMATLVRESDTCQVYGQR